jgi:hypothetical protein
LIGPTLLIKDLKFNRCTSGLSCLIRWQHNIIPTMRTRIASCETEIHLRDPDHAATGGTWINFQLGDFVSVFHLARLGIQLLLFLRL